MKRNLTTFPPFLAISFVGVALDGGIFFYDNNI